MAIRTSPDSGPPAAPAAGVRSLPPVERRAVLPAGFRAGGLAAGI
jgi:hypothetical protein